MTAPRSTRAVDRALSLLAAVCESGSMTLAESARRAELPASTALRLLRTLETWDLVRRDGDGSFRAGTRLLQLGALALGDESLAVRARPHLEQMVEQTGESAYVSVRGAGQTVLYIGQVEGTHAIRHISWVGKTVPLVGTAAGAALRGEVPAQGYVALRVTVEPDVTAIAAPVRGPVGTVVGALSLVGPTFRIDDDRLVRYGELLAEHARKLTAELGYRGGDDR
ncbi:MAG: helix-turn-helix domain-containing protein [Micromonosporaceae bacterium]|nr:helix-turn-helix domain-containing protein [Micromonosporaceae bacterium]